MLIHGHTHRSTHGKRRTREYSVWENMRARCNKPQNKDYKHYGGRGITVCSAWNASFAAFFADMGLCPSLQHTLDRKDNDGPYSPENCRWATWHEQHLNKRHARTKTFRWKTPYWKTCIDADGSEFSTLVIPKRLPPDWKMSANG